MYKDLVDSWEVYYNSNETFEKIADTDNIYDHEKMNEFRSISDDTKQQIGNDAVSEAKRKNLVYYIG